MSVVTVLMRSPRYRGMTLADLEWLLLPAPQLGQDAVLEGAATTTNGPSPTAIALWAFTSPQVDSRLASDPAAAVKLQPAEWRSGDKAWLFDAVGDAKLVPKLLAHLRTVTFKGRDLKYRSRNPDGTLIVDTLAAA